MSYDKKKEEEILQKLAKETKELMEQHKIQFGVNAAEEFRRRLQEWLDHHYPVIDEFELARLKEIEKFQEENPMNIGPNPIIIKLLVTKDGLKVL